MSIGETFAWPPPAGDGSPGPATQTATSPFAAASLTAEAAPAAPAAWTLSTPFSEALASLEEADVEAEALAQLRDELEDEEFDEALQALTDEAAARHLRAAGASWGQEEEVLSRAEAEAEQWLEVAAAGAERLLGDLEAAFAERGADTVTEAEIDAVTGRPGPGTAQPGSPVDAREEFLGKLVSKVKKVVKGVGRVVKAGVRAVGKVLPLGPVLAVLRKLVRPLLRRVLQKAIGKLPGDVQPIARRIAGRFGAGGAAAVPGAAVPGPA
ncbi:hypothetical protein GTR00_14180, partial [Kineococcus sp. T90]